MLFELADEDTARLKEQVLADVYSRSLADALRDGQISPEERQRLDAVAISFRLPRERTEAITRIKSRA